MMEKEIKCSGFWIRLGAFVIDYICYSLIGFIVIFIFGFIYGALLALTGNEQYINSPCFEQNANIIATIVQIFVVASYFVFFESSSKQGTIGKMACGLKVIDEDGRRLSRKLAFKRFVSSILSMLIFYIGFIMVAFNKNKRALHDNLSKTYVVNK